MKKILKKASALLIVGLVACTGRTITREQAITILQDIKAKQAEESFVYVTDFSVTQVTHMTGNNGAYVDYTTHLMYNAAEQKIKYEARMIQEAGSSSEDESQIQWVYVDGDTIYQVTDSNTSSGHNKVYDRVTENVADAWAQTVASVHTMFNDSLTQGGNAPDFYIGALQGAIVQDTTTTNVTISTELYTTSGDGNIVGSFVGSGSEGSTEYNSLNANFTFDNYRIVHSQVSITAVPSSSNEINGMAIVSDYLYSNIVITLPDLADFTDTTPVNPQ